MLQVSYHTKLYSVYIWDEYHYKDHIFGKVKDHICHSIYVSYLLH